MTTIPTTRTGLRRSAPARLTAVLLVSVAGLPAAAPGAAPAEPKPAPAVPVDARLKQLAAEQSRAAREGRAADAARLMTEAADEAGRVLRKEPWNIAARCVSASVLLQKSPSDTAGAKAALQGAPAPETTDDTEVVWVYALTGVLRASGETARADAFLQHLAGPRLRKSMAGNPVPPLESLVILLHAYGETYMRLGPRIEAAESFPALLGLLRTLIEHPDLPPGGMTGIGQQMEGLIRAVAEFRKQSMPGFAIDEQARTALLRLEELLRSLWLRLRRAAPQDPVPVLGLSTQLARFGRGEDAVRMLGDALSEWKGDSRVLLVQAKCRFLRAMGKTADELAFLEQELKLAPASAAILQFKAEAAAAAGRSDLIKEAATAAVAVDGTLLWARRALAELLLSDGKPVEAAAQLDAARAGVLRDFASLRLYARLLLSAGRGKDAGALVEELLAKAPATKAEADDLHGQSSAVVAGAVDAGRFDEAVDWSRRLLARSPDEPVRRMAHADALRGRMEAGKFPWPAAEVDATVAAYQAVIDKQSGNLPARNNLVWLLLRGKNDVRGAVAAARPMYALLNRNDTPPELLDTLAHVELARGNAETARAMAERAIKTARQQRAAFHLALAEACLKLGKLEDAEAALSTLAKLALPLTDLERADLRDIRKRLDEAFTAPAKK